MGFYDREDDDYDDPCPSSDEDDDYREDDWDDDEDCLHCNCWYDGGSCCYCAGDDCFNGDD